MDVKLFVNHEKEKKELYVFLNYIPLKILCVDFANRINY